MKVTWRFELFVSVSLPVPPMIVIDGIVELTEAAMVTLSFGSATLITIGPVSAVRSPQVSWVVPEQPPRAVTPPVGSSIVRLPATAETVTWFTSPAAAVYVNVVPPVTSPLPASAVSAKTDATAATAAVTNHERRRNLFTVNPPLGDKPCPVVLPPQDLARSATKRKCAGVRARRGEPGRREGRPPPALRSPRSSRLRPRAARARRALPGSRRAAPRPRRPPARRRCAACRGRM